MALQNSHQPLQLATLAKVVCCLNSPQGQTSCTCIGTVGGEGEEGGGEGGVGAFKMLPGLTVHVACKHHNMLPDYDYHCTVGTQALQHITQTSSVATLIFYCISVSTLSHLFMFDTCEVCVKPVFTCLHITQLLAACHMHNCLTTSWHRCSNMLYLKRMYACPIMGMSK